MTAASGVDAACSNDDEAGLGSSASSRTAAYSAKPPKPQANRLPNAPSPGANFVTAAPTASTDPATSVPRTPNLGRSKPTANRAKKGSARMMCQSAAFTEAARIRNKTWRALGLGVGISRSCRTSGGP